MCYITSYWRMPQAPEALMHIIGILSFLENSIHEIPIIERGLNRLGYAVHLEQMGTQAQSPDPGDYYYEKESVILWLCRCFGNVGRCEKAAEAFVAADVDAIVAMTDQDLQAALQATSGHSIPIVFTHITRERGGERQVEQLRMSDRVTGVWDIWPEIAAERLALITEMVPPASAVHAFYNPELPRVVAEARALEQASRDLGIRLVLHEVHDPNDVKNQLSHLQAQQDQALIRLADPTVEAFASLMGAVAHEQNIPYIGLSLTELERCGALFAIELQGTGELAAQILGRLLRGERPSSISCRQPSEKVLGVNLEAALDLGLILSPAVVSRAQITLPAQENKRLAAQFMSVLLLALFGVNIIVALTSQLNEPYVYALTAATTLALVIWIWVYLSRRVIAPIRELAITAEKIGAGQLNTTIADPKANAEISTLARALRRMRSNLRSSYANLDELNRNLQEQVDELTKANKALQIAKQKLELAGRRLVEAEDSGRFALTTYIHDEVYRPLDGIGAIAEELNHPALDKLAKELEQRIRQIRFELSAPILHDIGIELRRLIQEILPAVYPDAKDIKATLDVSCLDQELPLESAHIFLIYRFIRGAVSNAYRHSHATHVSVSAKIEKAQLFLSVCDNGTGFEKDQIDGLIEAGHYFFHDIEIRCKQLNGSLRIDSGPGCGTQLQINLPLAGYARKYRTFTMAPRNHRRDKQHRESAQP